MSAQAALFALEEIRSYSPQPKGDTPSWFTSFDYFLERERQLLAAGLLSRPFSLDPCGHDEAPVSQEILRRGGVVFTAEHDGLEQPWPAGSVPFCNPPFDAETVARFCARIRAELASGNISEAVLHVPAWTDRGWWHEHIEADRRAGRVVVWFEPGRQLYGWPGNPEGIGGDNATFPSAMVVWPRCRAIARKGT
jgi:hypothetical protein